MTDPADTVLSDSAGAVLVAYLADHNASLTAATADWRATRGGVHQIRVASRRLRSAIISYAPLLEGEAPPLSTELRWFGQELSELRDIEVVGPYLRNASAHLPDGPDSARAALDNLLATAELAAERRAGIALDSTRFAALRLRLRLLVEHPVLTEAAGTSAVEYAPRRVRRSAERLRRRIDLVTIGPSPTPDAPLHDVRKAAKRLRYTIEVAAPYLGRPGDDLRTQAENVQTVLGHHLDRLVAAAWWRRLADLLPARSPGVESRYDAELSRAGADLAGCMLAMSDIRAAIDEYLLASA